jgi:hypothetical protein
LKQINSGIFFSFHEKNRNPLTRPASTLGVYPASCHTLSLSFAGRRVILIVKTLDNSAISQNSNLQFRLIEDSCLELSKIKALKMLDLQTQSAIDSDKLQV